MIKSKKLLDEGKYNTVVKRYGIDNYYLEDIGKKLAVNVMDNKGLPTVELIDADMDVVLWDNGIKQTVSIDEFIYIIKSSVAVLVDGELLTFPVLHKYKSIDDIFLSIDPIDVVGNIYRYEFYVEDNENIKFLNGGFYLIARKADGSVWEYPVIVEPLERMF